MNFRQLLVSVRRELLPDMALRGITCHGPLYVGSYLRHRVPLIIGEEVIGQEIVLHDRTPIPILGITRVALRRTLARVTARAAFSEHGLAPREDRSIFRYVGRSTVGVHKVQRRKGPEKG